MKESEREWFAFDRAKKLINVVDADDTQPFITSDRLEPYVLKKLKAKGTYALRADLIEIGEKVMAEDIIFKKAYRL